MRNQPRDQEFEGVIADMTLVNFTHNEVNSFVSKIFDSKIPASSKLSNNHYPKPPPQPSFGGHGQPPNPYNQYPNSGYPHPSPTPGSNFSPPTSMPPPSNQYGGYSGHPGHPTEQPKQGKNLGDMNDEEFEGALDDFIKDLKDI